MRRKLTFAVGMLAAASLVLVTACSSDPSVEPAPTEDSQSQEAPDESPDSGDPSGADDAEGADDAGSDTEWFDQAVYDAQFAQRTVTPEGDPDKPYLQTIDAELIDTADFAVEGRRSCASPTRPSPIRGDRPAGSP